MCVCSPHSHTKITGDGNNIPGKIFWEILILGGNCRKIQTFRENGGGFPVENEDTLAKRQLKIKRNDQNERLDF